MESAATSRRQLIRLGALALILVATTLIAASLLARAYVSGRRSAIAHWFWTFFPEVQKPADQLVVDVDYWLENRIGAQNLTDGEIRKSQIATAEKHGDRWTVLLSVLKSLDTPPECAPLEAAYVVWFDAERARMRILAEFLKTGDPAQRDRFVEASGELQRLRRAANDEYLRMLRWPWPEWWPFR